MTNLSGIYKISRRNRILIVIGVFIVIGGVATYFLSSQKSTTAQTDSSPTLTTEERILKSVSVDSDTTSHSLTPNSVVSTVTSGQWTYAQVSFIDVSTNTSSHAIILYEDAYGSLSVVAGIDDLMTPDNLKSLTVPQSIIDAIPASIPAELDEGTAEN